MKPATDGPDARRTRETEQRLARAAQELEGMLENHERTARLATDVLAMARDLLRAYGEREGTRRLAKKCPKLSRTIVRIQDVARQITATIDDLQALMTSQL